MSRQSNFLSASGVILKIGNFGWLLALFLGFFFSIFILAKFIGFKF